MESRRLASGDIEYRNAVWKAITSEQSGMPVYAKSNEYAAFLQLKKQSKSDYNSLYFHNQIKGIHNRTGWLKSQVSKFRVQEHVLNLEGGELHYHIDNGRAFVTDVKIDINHRYKGKRPAAGLYNISVKDGAWVAARKPSKNLSHTHIAINGYSENIDHASEMMSAFIERGYKPEVTLSSLKVTGYNLFYNPSHGGLKSDMRQVIDSVAIGKGTQASEQLAALIEQQALKGGELNWTVHEKGHALFKKALQHIVKQKLTPALKEKLGKQKVFYANPTMNLSVVDSYRTKAGMQLGPNPPLINNMSLEQTWFTGNFVSETLVSYRQLQEQGENSNRNVSLGHIGNNVIGRIGMTALGGYALPQALGTGVIGWGATWLGIASSNSGGANQKVIEGTADVLNDVILRVKKAG